MVLWLFAVCWRVLDCLIRACDPLDPEFVDSCIPQFDGGPESRFGELTRFQNPSEPIHITARSHRKILVYQHHNWRLCKCVRERDVSRHGLEVVSLWCLLKITRKLCTMSAREGMLPTSLRHVLSAGTSSSFYSPCRPFLLVAASSSSLFLPRPALSKSLIISKWPVFINFDKSVTNQRTDRLTNGGTRPLIELEL